MLIYTVTINSSVICFIQTFKVYTHNSWKRIRKKEWHCVLTLLQGNQLLLTSTFRDGTGSHGIFLPSNTILGYELMGEIKYVHSAHYLVLLFFFFISKRYESKDSEISVYHQNHRVVTKSCNRKTQKKKKVKIDIMVVVYF